MALAQGFNGEVALLRVVTPAELEYSGGLYALSRVWEQQERQTARAYLEDVRRRCCHGAAGTLLAVEMGPTPMSIIATADRLHAGLIVMSTHGRSGVNRLLYGSVAEAVVRAATVPVLLVPGRYQPPAPAD